MCLRNNRALALPSIIRNVFGVNNLIIFILSADSYDFLKDFLLTRIHLCNQNQLPTLNDRQLAVLL